MTNDSANVDRVLAQLPSMAPETDRDARIRARCCAVLTSRALAAERSRHRLALWQRVVAPALVGGFCVVYLSVLVVGVLGLTF